jgi:Fanconi anemia group M protein
VRITVDYRETASGIIELFSDEGVYLEVKKISHGDYIINDTITVERKTARDFLVSIVDGRLFNQLSNLKKHCICPIVLIEGNPYKTDLDFDHRAIRGALVSTQTVWYIPVLFSKTKEQTKDLLLVIARQDEVLIDGAQVRGGYRPKRLRTRQLYILQGLPGVGPLLAKRLIHHFGTVSKVMAAPVEELKEVEGIGNKAAGKIRAVLDSQ